MLLKEKRKKLLLNELIIIAILGFLIVLIAFLIFTI